MKSIWRHSINDVRRNYCCVVVCRAVDDGGLKMPAPSDTKFDSSTPDASETPSTSGQPTSGTPIESIEYEPNRPQLRIPSTSGQPSTRPPPPSVENDRNNPPLEGPSTSGQPIIRPPPSSIEYDPNNPPLETPSSGKERVPVGKELTCCQRVKIQLSAWREHLDNFRLEVFIAIIIAIAAVVFIILAYSTQWKVVFLGVAWVTTCICFALIWLKIEKGPPFLSDELGNPVKPKYLLTQKLRDSACDMMSTPERKRLRKEERRFAFLHSPSF